MAFWNKGTNKQKLYVMSDDDKMIGEIILNNNKRGCGQFRSKSSPERFIANKSFKIIPYYFYKANKKKQLERKKKEEEMQKMKEEENKNI